MFALTYTLRDRSTKISIGTAGDINIGDISSNKG